MSRKYIKPMARVGLERAQARNGYLFVLPIIVGIFLIYGPILVRSLIFSFNELLFDPAGNGYSLEFRGWAYYYKAFFQDSSYVVLIVQSVKDMCFDLLFILIFSFFVAVLLNQNFKGRSFARVIFFMPVVLATGMISKAESGDLLLGLHQASEVIDIGELGGIGLPGLKSLLQQSALRSDFVSVILSGVEKTYDIVVSSGVQILVFLSGLQGIPLSMREAAEVEGCTAWEYFWKITLPMISPLILVNSIFTMIDSLTDSGNPLMQHITDTAIKSINFSYAAAMSWAYFLIVAVVMTVVFLMIGGYAKRQKS